MNDDYSTKDYYLSKPGEEYYLGLHSTGTEGEHGWMSIEAWVNVYNLDKTFHHSDSRLFGPIEDAAADLVSQGWTVVPNWEIK